MNIEYIVSAATDMLEDNQSMRMLQKEKLPWIALGRARSLFDITSTATEEKVSMS